jgi:2-polyprenyl-3-methyl-5-hydroxy-6-metoxy-1,4-benzoquinol methylase
MPNWLMDGAYYESKEGKYFGFARQEIAPLLPDPVRRVMEIGCGAGATLSWLKSIRQIEYAAGIELMAAPAEEARAVCEEVLVGDVERIDLPFQPASFDLILALDVLEHLVNPWALVPRLHALLRPGGHLIASIPNVAHYSVSLPLLRGRWTYVRSGILDATHLRFFVQNSVEQLLTCSGMVIDQTEPVIRVPWDLHRVIGWRRNQRLQHLAGRVLPHPFTYQFLMRAKNVTQ